MIWLVGHKGRLGAALGRAFTSAGLAWVGTGREVDIGDAAAVNQFGTGRPIRLVVNAAGYTAVDQAELEPDACYQANVLGPRNLARWTSVSGTTMVHFSTDFVFSGPGPEPWDEDSPGCSNGVYATTKWQGEGEVRRLCPRHLIFRTAWLYGDGRLSFVETILDLVVRGLAVRVVDDQWGCPTWTGALAPLVVDVVKSESLAWGTYHLAGSGHASRYELALAIRSEAIACHLVSSEAAGEIVPVASSDFPTPAPRPGWSALSTEKFRKAFGRELPPWRESLRRYIQTRSAQSVE